MNTDSLRDFRITVDYGASLTDMIEAGRYDLLNHDITAEMFPFDNTGTKKFRAKLFDFGRYISSEDAVAAMTKENFTPGSHVHGLAFGATFPQEQRKYLIVCLGSSAQVLGLRLVVCLHGGPAGRRLDLGGWGGGWGGRRHFLGVQEVSDA